MRALPPSVRAGTVSSWPSTCLSCLAASAVLSLPRAAAADTSSTNPVDFVWDAPLECPTTATILMEVAKISSTAPSTRKWRARASVERGAGGVWALHLSTEVDGRQDTRDFSAASCADLAATAAVVLAVAIDPTRVAAPPVAAVVQPAAPAPPPDNPPPPPPLVVEPADAVVPPFPRSLRQFVV